MPRVTLPRIAALVAALAIVGVSTLAAEPAFARDGLLPPTIVGSIDQIAVAYGENSDAPMLHVTGWAANLVEPTQNGLIGNMAVELVGTPAAGGATQVVAWVEGNYFAASRPDVAKAYPGLGPNHGWDNQMSNFSHTGTWTICARIWDMDAAMPTTGWIQLACSSVTVPAKRPAFRPSIQGTPWVGQNLQAVSAAAPPTGVSVSYQWTTLGHEHWFPQPIPGATSGQHTPAVAEIGHSLGLTTLMRQSGHSPIEQQAAAKMVSYGVYHSDRIAGSDRYGTSVAASQKAFPDAAAGTRVAYLVSGQNYPDALSAGPAAAKQGGTMLLTRPGALPAAVANELVRLHPATVVVVGGPVAVSDAVLARVRALPFAPAVVRVAGSNRYSTSRAVLQYAFGTSAPTLFLATGRGFADALTAGTAAAGQGVPVLLTDGSLRRADAATVAELRVLGTLHVSIVGGTAVVTPGVASSLGSGVTVARLAGADRFGTAAAVAATLGPSPTAYLASAYNFPDALVVAVLAGRDHAPLFLSSGICVPRSALSTMLRRLVVQGTVVGGNAVMNAYTTDPFACSY